MKQFLRWTIFVLVMGHTQLLAQCFVTPNFTTSASYCGTYPGTVTLTNTSTGTGTDVATYQWYRNGAPIGAPVVGIAPFVDNTIPSPATYTYMLEVTDTSGCTDDRTRSFTALRQPISSFTYPAGALCGSNRVQFTNTSTNLTASPNYLWNFGDGSGTSNQTNPNHKFPSGGGTYTVTLTVTNSGGCSHVSSQTITITNAPVADFLGSGAGPTGMEFCFGSTDPTTSITPSFIDGSTNAVSYSWNFGDPASGAANTSTLPNPSHTYNSSGTYPVTLTVTSASGCTDQITRNILFAKAPSETNIGMSLDGISGCPPLNVRVTGLTNVAGFTNFAYELRSGSLGGPAVQSYTGSGPADLPNFIVSTAGTYFLVLTASTPCGSVDASHVLTTAQGPISVPNLAQANFSYTLAGTTEEGTSPGNYSGRGCASNRVSFTNNSTFAVPVATAHKWYFDRFPGDSLLGVRTPPTQVFKKGVYNVKLISSNSCGTDTAVQTIFIDTLSIPDFNILPNDTGCTTFIPNLINTTIDGGSTTYQWSRNTYCCVGFPSSCGQFCTMTSAGPAEPSVAFRTFTSLSNTSPTNWSVSLQVSNGCGVRTRTKQITVHPLVDSRPLVNGSTAAVQICEGQSVTFSDGSFGTPLYGQPTMQYQWVFGNGNNAAAGGSHTQAYATQGTYWAKLRVTGYCGTDLDSVQVIVKPYPVAVIVPNDPDSVCMQTGTLNFSSTGSSITTPTPIPGPTLTYLWNFGTGASPATSTLPNPTGISWSSSGSKTVTLTVTQNGCSDVATTTIRVDPRPTPAFTRNPTAATCSPATLTFTNNTNGAAPENDGNTYSWDFGDGTIVAGANPGSHTYVHSGNNFRDYNITLTATNRFGCTQTTIQTQRVLPQPLPSFTVTPTDGCEDVAVTITNTSTPTAITGNMNLLIYEWSFSPGAINTSTSAPISTFTGYTPPAVTFTTPSPTNFVALNIRERISGFGECNQRDTVYINVRQRPTVNFTASPTDACAPVTVTLNNLVAFDPTASYAWTFGDGNTSSTWNGGGTHVYTNTGTTVLTRNLKLVTTLANGCKDSLTRAITVRPIPKADITAVPDNGCQDLQVNFVNNSTPSSGAGVTYTWNFGTGAVNTSTGLAITTFNGYTAPGITYTTPGTKSVTFTVTQSGCSDDTTITLTVIPKDTARFTVDKTTGCNPLTVTATNTTTPNANLTYRWDFGDGSPTSSLPNPAPHVYTNPGATNLTRNLKLVVTNTLSGCKDSLTRVITITPSPFADIESVPPAGCQELRVDLLNHSSPAFDPFSQYVWDFGSGAIYTGSGLPATTLPSYIAPSITYLTPGIKTVKFKLTTNGCPDSMIINITVVPKDTARYTVDKTSGCSPLNVNITNTTTLNPDLTYTWTFGDGSPTSGVINPGSHVYVNNTASPVTYNLKLKVLNGVSGCPDSMVVPITVDPSPDAVLPALTNACANTPYTLPNNSTGATGFLWDFGDGSPLMAGATPVHQWVNNTTGNINYTVKLVATNGQNCKDSMTQVLTVRPQPKASFSLNTVCRGNPTQFTDLSVNGVTYSWSFGDGSPVDNTNGNVQHTYPSAGNYNATLTVVGSNGCSHDTTIAVSVLQAPVAAYSATSACLGQTTVFTDQTTNIPGVNFPVSWRWDFGDGSPASTLQSPTYRYAAPNSYNVKLVVTNNTGCKDSVIRVVDVAPKPISSFTVGRLCSGKPTVFNGTQTGPGTFTYLWDFGDGSSPSTLPAPSKAFTNPGTYNVRLTTGFAGGCTDDTVIAVTVIRSPVAGFNLPANVCFRQTASFTNTSIANGTTGTVARYEWDFGDGSAVLNGLGATITNPTHLYAAAGTYNVRLVVENTDGCTDTLTRAMTIRALADPAFTATRVCFGTATAFTNATVNGVSYNWNFGDPASGGANTSTAVHPTHTYTAVGTYNVTLVARHASGCDTTIVRPVTVDSIPVAIFTTAHVCSTAAAVFVDQSTGAPVRWDWNFGNGDTRTISTGTIGTTSYQYLVPGTYTVTLTVTNQHGCSNTTNRSITVHPVPTANFRNNLVCATAPTQFTDLSIANSVTRPIVAWEWDFGDGSPLLSGSTAAHQNPTHIYTVGGSYSVRLVVFNDQGCSDTLQGASVSVDMRPTASYTFAPVCLGDSTFFTNTSTANAGGAISHYWDFGDGNNSDSKDPSYIFKSLGNWPVKLIVTNLATGCQDSVTQIVNLRNTALAEWTADSVCQGEPTLFQNLTANVNANTYLWDFGPLVAGSTAINPSIVFPTPGNRTVLLRTVDANGCISFYDTIVSVLPIPDVSFVYSTPLPTACTNNAIDFRYTGTTPNINTNYIWDFGDGTVRSGAGLSTISHNFAAQQTYNVKLYVENTLGCVDSAINAITISQNIIPGFNTSSVCVGQAATFTNTSVAPSGGGPLSYRWDMGNGVIFNVPDPGNASYIYNVAGTYNVTLTVTNFQGCQASITNPIIVANEPGVDFSFNTACVGEPTNFTDLTTGSPGVWLWDFGDPASGASNSSTLQNPTHTFTTHGAFLVRLYASNGCGAERFRAILVQQPLIADFDITPDDTVCLGDPFTFRGRSANNAVTEEWNLGDGSPVQTYPAGTSFRHTYTNPGTYTVTLRTQGQNCFTTVTKQVHSLGDIVVNFSTVKECLNEPVVFVNNTPDLPGSLYIWDFGDGSENSAERNPTHRFPAVGTYNVQQRVFFDQRLCEAVATQTVTIPVLPTATFTLVQSQLLLPRDQAQVVYTGTGATSLTWQWGDGTQTVVTTDLYAPVFHQYEDMGDYTIRLIATNDMPCNVTDSIPVQTMRDTQIRVPTAFSPNQDGENDRWRAISPFQFKEYSIQVFSRWGQLVFESHDIFEYWDGRQNGVRCQEGAYVWKIKAVDHTGQIQELVGTVTLVH